MVSLTILSPQNKQKKSHKLVLITQHSSLVTPRQLSRIALDSLSTEPFESLFNCLFVESISLISEWIIGLMDFPIITEAQKID